jgi:hypothetical protein
MHHPPAIRSGQGRCLWLMYPFTLLAAQLGLVGLLLVQSQLLLFLGARALLAGLGGRILRPLLGLDLLLLPFFLMDAFAILSLYRRLLRLVALLYLIRLARTGHPAAHAYACPAFGLGGATAQEGKTQQRAPQYG